MNEQMNFMDLIGLKSDDVDTTSKIEVVNAAFSGSNRVTWQDLFEGYDELYAITYSSGIRFVNSVIDRFSYAEVIFGCEGVMSGEIAAIMSMQMETIRQFVKSKSAKKLSERLGEGTLKLFVSRDTRSHEKIFILKANDGRVRVITGSANMSSSAFCGIQRENILCFDDWEAYDHFFNIFECFREQCSDYVSEKVINGAMADGDYLMDNVEEVPIVKTIEKKSFVLLEESNADAEDDAIEIIANIKGLEGEMKPMLPKIKKDAGKVFVTSEVMKGFRRKHREHREIKKAKEKRLPKLHIDYATRKVDFNGNDFNMNPGDQAIAQDVKCLTGYLNSLNCFYGDVEQSQRDYFLFLNWFFASPFMPYLRYVASMNNYEVTPFPVVGIIYGDSNGGKSTFTKLMSKLMCGHRIPMNSSNDFTSTRIEELKRACEGLPIIIDDLAKIQFQNHSEKVIKDDDWGIPEGFINYPAIAITTNKLASLPQDITKRAVTCHVDARIDKEAGAKNSRRINESMKMASTALFSEYARRMFEEIDTMEEKMKMAGTDYFPDIFEVSSKTLVDIISSSLDEVPSYVIHLKYADYFGDKAVGRTAMQKIMNAWKTEPSQFRVDKKSNTLTYSYPEQGRFYELAYIQQELPPVLNARITAKCIIMDLDSAQNVFDNKFRKRFLWR